MSKSRGMLIALRHKRIPGRRTPGRPVGQVVRGRLHMLMKHGFGRWEQMADKRTNLRERIVWGLW